MSNIVDFNTAKDIKDGTASPKHVIDLLHESMEKGETDPEVIIYICKMKDGTIALRYSDVNLTEGVGLLQASATNLIEQMRC